MYCDCKYPKHVSDISIAETCTYTHRTLPSTSLNHPCILSNLISDIPIQKHLTTYNRELCHQPLSSASPSPHLTNATLLMSTEMVLTLECSSTRTVVSVASFTMPTEPEWRQKHSTSNDRTNWHSLQFSVTDEVLHNMSCHCCTNTT